MERRKGIAIAIHEAGFGAAGWTDLSGRYCVQRKTHSRGTGSGGVVQRGYGTDVGGHAGYGWSLFSSFHGSDHGVWKRGIFPVTMTVLPVTHEYCMKHRINKYAEMQ